MKGLLATVTAGLLCALLAACVHPSRFSADDPVAPGTIGKVDALYVYSFLDVRMAELGEPFMKEVEARITHKFMEQGVRTTQLWFRRTPQSVRVTSSQGSIRIPIIEVVKANAEAERASGARYRLVMSPIGVGQQGSNMGFDVRFDLTDAASGKLVWTTRSTNGFLMWTSSTKDSTAPERAAVFVDALVAEMKKQGALGA